MTPYEFTKAALDDCQLTIRALDVKCGAVLVLLLAPLPNVSRIFEALERIPSGFAAKPLGILFFGLWGLSLLSLIRGLAPLDNPAEHIPDHKAHTGSFYRGSLYKFGFFDALLKRSVIISNKKVSDAVAELPQAAADIEKELTFEHMKLCYIRDIKIRLLAWGIGFAEAWLIAGAIIYLLARYGH